MTEIVWNLADEDNQCWADSRRPMLEPGPCREFAGDRLGLCTAHAASMLGPAK